MLKAYNEQMVHCSKRSELPVCNTTQVQSLLFIQEREWLLGHLTMDNKGLSILSVKKQLLINTVFRVNVKMLIKK